MDPIAIVGMGCRLPGGVKSPGDLWELIMAEKIANNPRVPFSRFNVDAHYHQDNDRPGSFKVSGGYFLDDHPADFDPTMFKLSPVEAMWMDPQQRKLLEVVYEAFENSGSSLKDVSQQITGCFVASFTSDFQQIALKEPDFRHSYGTTGIDPGLLGNRISHVFDLKGPSVLLNTACSSSMYALDSACLSINRGECEGAIVGGTNWILTVDQHMNTAKLGVLSPTSTCHSFDEAADGYGRAEAVGALYIKSLSAAIRDRNPIRAVIRSVATNANGKHSDNGITYPSLQGQVDVIETAHRLGNLDQSLTSYIECHGTGTQTGDPIEVRAISRAFRNNAELQTPILIGSVKPNIGHSEAASSICTIMKAVLALEHGVIPPTAGIKTLNQSIDWNGLNVKVVTKPTPFPSGLSVQRIGVSAFGYGGTNGHAILESVRSLLPDYNNHKLLRNAGTVLKNGYHNGTEDHAHLLLLSAHAESALMKNVAAYQSICNRNNLLDIAHTLGAHRSRHGVRTFAVCRESHCDSDLVIAKENAVSTETPGHVAFVFSGQGAQWAQMGHLLFRTYPTFLHTIRKLDAYLKDLANPPGWSIETIISLPESISTINEAAFSQPLCTAIQIALVDLLSHWGINPVATVGHSSGEIAAAYCAGYISAQEAIIVAYFRGIAVSSPARQGAMLAVGLGADQICAYMEGYAHRLVIACHNSPDSVTISGDADAIHELKSTLNAAGIFGQIVKTGGQAYHSHHMEDVAAKYLRLLNVEQVSLQSSNNTKPRVPMFSTVTGLPLAKQILNAAYWSENLKSPVLFNQAVYNMLKDEIAINIIVEIGPHATLAGAIRKICANVKLPTISYMSTLKRKENDQFRLLSLAGNLWVRNVAIDVKAVTAVERLGKDESVLRKLGTLLVDLPPYQWDYGRRLWAESRQSQEHRCSLDPRHDILGRKVLGTSSLEPVWRNILRHKDLPWLKHHSLGSEAVFPAAGYFAMAIEAVTQANSYLEEPFAIDGYTLRNIIISSALVIPDSDEGVEILFSMRPGRGNLGPTQWKHFTVTSLSHGEWKEHANGKIDVNIRSRGIEPRTLPSLPSKSSYQAWNEQLRTLGFDFGPSFQNSTSIHTSSECHTASVDMTIKRQCGFMNSESRYVIHPACIDSCLQPTLIAIHKGKLDDVVCGNVLTRFDEVSIWPPTSEQLENGNARAASWMSRRGTRNYLCDSQLVSHDGELLADFSNIHLRQYEVAKLTNMDSQQDLYTKQDWKIDVDYLSHAGDAGQLVDMTWGRITELFIHKNASLSILCFGIECMEYLQARHTRLNITFIVRSAVELESLESIHNAENSIKILQLDTNREIFEQYAELGAFDLIIVSRTSRLSDTLSYLHTMMNPHGHLLLVDDFTDTPPAVPDELYCPYSFRISSSRVTICTSTPDPLPAFTNPGSVLLVYRHNPTPFQKTLSSNLEKLNFTVRSATLGIAEPQPQESVVVLTDLESPVFSTLSPEELHALQKITDGISSVAWVTCGGLRKGLRPEHGMAAGWARVVRNENQLLDLVLVDINDVPSSQESLRQVLLDILQHWATHGGSEREKEYYIDDGAVYVGRLVSDRKINDRFSGYQEPKETVLEDAPALRGVSKAGKIAFRLDEQGSGPLGDEDVEIIVRAIGLNKEDANATTGLDFSSTFSHEIAGLITHTGSGVPKSLAVGDKVFGFSFDTMATVQRTHYSLVSRMSSDQTWKSMAAVPMACATALYALEDLARVEPNETVVIIDGCSAAGQVAIQLCNNLGATIIVITDSESTVSFLQTSGIPVNGILNPKKDDISSGLQRLTNGIGIDILLCSASINPSLLEDCSRTFAPFGRIVICGNSEQLAVPTFSAVYHPSILTFDLQDLYHHRSQVLSELLERSTKLLQNGSLKPIYPLTLISPIRITESLRTLPSTIGLGKHVLEYTSGSIFNVQSQHQALQFSPDATYLLVGCLGGIGRSLSTWMIQKGARHLAFLSRSGTDYPVAAELVDRIRAMGVNVQVLRADVTVKEQVETAISTIRKQHPIQGVLNAAVVLRDGFFHNMNTASWHQVLSPKVKGSLVLHDIFSTPGELDFFVMTSSISATLGASGQSNYAAANSFIDALAHHRHSLSLPGISLVLPAITGIGYISENPLIEASIRRRGMSCINEAEMLRAFEVAMTSRDALPDRTSHIIAGLQPSQLATSIKGAKADTLWILDARLRSLRAAMGSYEKGESKAASIMALVQELESEEEAIVAVMECLIERLSRLLMIGVEEIRVSGRSLATYGLDSMIGAEFRNWVFKEFRVDLPFQQLLAKNLTVERLAAELCGKVRMKGE